MAIIIVLTRIEGVAATAGGVAIGGAELPEAAVTVVATVAVAAVGAVAAVDAERAEVVAAAGARTEVAGTVAAGAVPVV